jgi:two-component system LytT family response regulator
MRVQVIDDEAHSLQLMQHLLADVDIVVDVHMSLGAQKGLVDIHKYRPDLLFLDIHMPHLDGFEVLQSVEDRNFGVIFTTAYNQHAIRAFKVNAFDYLLKPVTSVDLQASIQRFVLHSHKVQPQQVATLSKQLQSQNNTVHRLAVRTLKGIRYVDLDKVVYFESSGNLCYAHLLDDCPLLVNMLLKEVESLTTHYRFYRVHRSFLINISKVKEVLTTDNPLVIMVDGSSLSVSRRRKPEFLKLLSSCE